MLDLVKKALGIQTRNMSVDTIHNGIVINHNHQKLLTLTVENDELGLTINRNFKLKIEGEFDVEVDNQVDVTTHGDLNLDTWKSQLHMNSRRSKHIKDLDDAIEYRKQASEIMRKHQLFVDHHKEILTRIDAVIDDFQQEKNKELGIKHTCGKGDD